MRLKVTQVYKAPKTGSGTQHTLPKWPLSSHVTSSRWSNSSSVSTGVEVYSEGAEQWSAPAERQSSSETCPSGHTLASQSPGAADLLSASWTAWPTRCSPGWRLVGQASGGSLTTPSSPYSLQPPQDEISNPGNRIGVNEVRGGESRG